MTTEPAPPPGNPAMVRVLIVAIALMTVAIVGILGAMMAKLLAPAERAPSGPRTIDFSAADVVEIGLPAGARVLETHVEPGRATFVVETAQGERAVYTTPLTGLYRPVRFQFRSME